MYIDSLVSVNVSPLEPSGATDVLFVIALVLFGVGVSAATFVGGYHMGHSDGRIEGRIAENADARAMCKATRHRVAQKLESTVHRLQAHIDELRKG